MISESGGQSALLSYYGHSGCLVYDIWHLMKAKSMPRNSIDNYDLSQPSRKYLTSQNITHQWYHIHIHFWLKQETPHATDYLSITGQHTFYVTYHICIAMEWPNWLRIFKSICSRLLSGQKGGRVQLTSLLTYIYVHL